MSCGTGLPLSLSNRLDLARTCYSSLPYLNQIFNHNRHILISVSIKSRYRLTVGMGLHQHQALYYFFGCALSISAALHREKPPQRWDPTSSTMSPDTIEKFPSHL